MTVEFEERGAVAVVTINRPHARNAVNGDVAVGIEAAIDRIEESEHLRAAVLAGAPPAFCAGADLKEINRTGSVAAFLTERGGFAGIVSRERTKPVVAAVDGPALAGGFEIVLACDMVVASVAARFGLPEATRGLIAAAGLFRLGRKIPLNVAMACALTGDPISAERAFELGFVNALVEPGGVVDASVALATRIAENAPVSVRESRRVLLEAPLVSDGDAWRISMDAMAKVWASDDVAEGVAAYVDKRAPRWTGR